MIDDRKEKREQENNKRFEYERDVKRAALEQEMISQRDKEMAYQHKAMLQVRLRLSLSPRSGPDSGPYLSLSASESKSSPILKPQITQYWWGVASRVLVFSWVVYLTTLLFFYHTL